MLSIIEQIKQGQLWDFPGGIHPPEQKTLSNRTPIAKAELPPKLILPLKQHLGAIGDVLVSVGDTVKKGQMLTHTDVALSVPIHAPTSGTVIAIEQHTIAHPSGLSDRCIVIEPDGQETWIAKTPVANYHDATPADLIDHIRLHGIAGMGGAGFPAGRKLQSGLGKTDILIINAAECEPYITADDRLMQDCAQEVIEGIRILQHILQPKLTVIGIEDNKPEAITALQHQLAEHDQIVIRVIPTKYPSGGEKQLIKVLTGKEVPSKGIPADIGIMMHNVGTTHAIKRAVIDGEPLIQRVVTVTGQTVKQPGNTWALLGTPVQFLLERFGFQADKKLSRVIMGGPMMGFTLPHTAVPVTKISNCILAPTRKEISPANHEMACIRCTACAEACPVSLLPQQLQWYAKDEDFEKCEEYNLFDCIECGACAYVCPSEIPLVHYYRQAKAEIRHRKQDEINAERAKLRFEAKNARLERDKQERENRFKKAADDRRKEMKSTGGDDAVAAAIARVKAKQEAAATDATAEKKPAVAAAIARAKAKQAEAQAAQSDNTEALPDNTEMAKLREERKRQARERKAEKQAAETTKPDSEAPVNSGDAKKDAVAAAIARAKARKAAQQNNVDQTETSEADPKKAAVAAAIARAKARKATQQAESATPEKAEIEQADTEPADAPAEDPKKAAVAAAIARAKARKAAQQAESAAPEKADTEQADTEPADAPAADPKKAAVAAAIARAKARKAAQQAESAASEKPDTEQADAEPADAPAEDPKKAAVAAAIARAKARKAAQQAESATPEKADTEQADAEQADTPAEDPKKAAVAAAIARAKARKAAKEAEQAGKDAPQNHEEN
ncbi:electron transport complex subunit RsxC [Photobacterium sp. MCCC 1A19761]|uniref:electron transport complex subunit RsxC n=1 Tax=Photobacterium sp. MCCC 1A19761 TaxID=3115000 RepID=UPI00307F5E5E